MKSLHISLAVILLTGTAAKAACNRSSYQEAKLRCATSLKQNCIRDVYMALEGGGIDAATDALECSLGDFGDAMEMTTEEENRPPSPQPSTPQQTPSRRTTSTNQAKPTGGFHGISPFGQPQTNAPIMQAPGYPYPGMLPPQVEQMMKQMQKNYNPNPATTSCQGVTTSTQIGFDQNGNEASQSKLEKFEVVQIVRSQRNSGRTYFLSTNGYWYDAGYIKKSPNCNL